MMKVFILSLCVLSCQARPQGTSVQVTKTNSFVSSDRNSRPLFGPGGVFGSFTSNTHRQSNSQQSASAFSIGTGSGDVGFARNSIIST